MRTTITIDDQLLEAAKEHAAGRGSTLSSFIQDAIRMALAKGAAGKRKHRFKLVTFRGDGPRPGVDLDRTSALIEADDIAAFADRGRQ